VVAQTNHQLS